MASNTNGSEDKPVESLVGGRYLEMGQDGDPKTVKSRLSGFLWHGGSAYDAWFSCASNQVHISSLLSIRTYFLSTSFNSTKSLFFHRTLICFCSFFLFGILQVAQVLLTLPYSFSQLGMTSGILFQLFYGLLGSWTAYLISILYIEYRTRKEREKVDFRNHVIQVSNNL